MNRKERVPSSDKKLIAQELVDSHVISIAQINGTDKESGCRLQDWRPGHYEYLLQSLRDLPRIATAAQGQRQQGLSSDDKALLWISVGFFYPDFNTLYPDFTFPEAMQALDTVHGGKAGDERKELLRFVMNAAFIKKGLLN